MQRAALVALPHFSIGTLSALLERLTHQDWRIRTLSFDGRPVTTAEGVRIMVDASLTDTVPLDFNLMIIPGGRYGREVWEDIRFHRFLRQYDGQRNWFAVTKEGVICLAAASLLGGVMYSLQDDVAEEYSHLLLHAIHCQDPVTADANVISSDGTDPETWAFAVCQRLEFNAPLK